MALQSAEIQHFSASTDGKQIKVTATSTAGTTIHSTASGKIDQVFLYASSITTADVVLTIEWGGVAAPDDNLIQTIPGKEGDFLMVSGKTLGNGKTIQAFAAVANTIMISGFVQRLTNE